MAANHLLACYPATSWYDFTYSLSWSNDCEVAEILSDVPFISVGILAFAMSALFLFLNRLSLSAFWLFCSTLLAFIGAVLDLGHALSNEKAASATFIASQPTIRAREVLFALSIGLRFLFYWSYVGEPPLKARSTPATQRVQRIGFLTLERTEEMHSGSWIRRGLPCRVLGIPLLVAIVTITALQIVWRVVPRFHQYSNIYAADVALELLAAVVLLVKLLSNTVTGDSHGLVHTFRECLPPISGLLVNISIGVGDLLNFAFTESTVGRLLQAFEIYIIIVFVVTTALLRHRDTLLFTASSQGNTRKDAGFTLPEPSRVSLFRITPPVVETPRMSMVLSAAIQNKGSTREMLSHSARRSLNHATSWVSGRFSKNRLRNEDEEAKLWDAEEAKVSYSHIGSVHTQLLASAVSLAREPEEWPESRNASANHVVITPALDTRSAIAQSMKGSIHGDQTVPSHRGDVPQHTLPLQAQISAAPVSSISATTSPRTEQAESVPGVPKASPVYGLEGIQSPPSAPDSRTSLDKLLRQQSQLDQSIEALKLFSTRMSINSSSSNSIQNRKSTELARSPSTGQRTVCSDVSLSSFPVPPWSTTPVPMLPSPHLSPVVRIRGDRRVRLAAALSTPIQDTCAPVPPNVSASLADIPSSPLSGRVPHSPLGEENESLPAELGKFSPFDSGGTRYNVTSFIGGLATPDEPGQGSREKLWWPRESDSGVGAIQASSSVKIPSGMSPVLRRLEKLPASPAAIRLSPLSRSSRPSQGVVVDELANTMQHRIDDQASSSLVIALSPQTPVTQHPEKGLPTPPTRPQPARVAGSPITGSAEGADRAQRIFVRPRPPPLALRSYGTPQVQVLTED